MILIHLKNKLLLDSLSQKEFDGSLFYWAVICCQTDHAKALICVSHRSLVSRVRCGLIARLDYLALFRAIVAIHPEVINETILEGGWRGQTVLMVAARSGSINIVRRDTAKRHTPSRFNLLQ